MCGGAWIVLNHQGDVLFHAREAFLPALNDLHIEALELSFGCAAAIEATMDSSNWPRDQSLTSRIHNRLPRFQKISFQTSSSKANRIAREIAKSVTHYGRFQSYLARGGPAWLHNLIEKTIGDVLREFLYLFRSFVCFVFEPSCSQYNLYELILIYIKMFHTEYMYAGIKTKLVTVFGSRDDQISAMEIILSKHLTPIPPIHGVNNDLIPFQKSFYREVAEISMMTEDEATIFRYEHGIIVSGDDIPKIVRSWSQLGLVTKILEKLKQEVPTPFEAQILPILLSREVYKDQIFERYEVK